MNAQTLFDILNQSRIRESSGFSSFNFMNTEVRITSKSTIGYLFQNWLEKWMENNNINFTRNLNSQQWPDFFLDPDENNSKGVVELKTFEVNEGPNFDVANFDAYQRSLLTHAYRLDADYIIVCYELTADGIFSVKNLWLKKIWQICTKSERYPIKSQVKQGVIVNIRPANFHSRPTFNSRREFVEAIYQTLLKYPPRSSTSLNWLVDVGVNYKSFTGKDL